MHRDAQKSMVYKKFSYQSMETTKHILSEIIQHSVKT